MVCGCAWDFPPLLCVFDLFLFPSDASYSHLHPFALTATPRPRRRLPPHLAAACQIQARASCSSKSPSKWSARSRSVCRCALLVKEKKRKRASGLFDFSSSLSLSLSVSFLSPLPPLLPATLLPLFSYSVTSFLVDWPLFSYLSFPPSASFLSHLFTRFLISSLFSISTRLPFLSPLPCTRGGGGA